MIALNAKSEIEKWAEVAAKNDVTTRRYRRRISDGWEPEAAATTPVRATRLKRRVYTLYRGEEMIGVGTVDELAAMHNIQRNTIWHATSPACQKRAEARKDSKALIAVVMDDESEEDVCEE